MNVVQSSWIANNVSVNPGTRSQAFQAVSLPQLEGGSCSHTQTMHGIWAELWLLDRDMQQFHEQAKLESFSMFHIPQIVSQEELSP